MNRFRTLVTCTLAISLLFSCNKQQGAADNTKSLTDLNPGINPLLKLDQDTIQFGDSLTGIIGAVFKPSITEKQRQQLINTISYRIDTTDTKLIGDTIFYKYRRLNDTTFRFAILPKYNDEDLIEKKTFHASIKVQFFSSDNQKQDYIFRNGFEYYVKK